MYSSTSSSAVCNGRDPPPKRSRSTEPISDSSLLPYDLQLNCLARVSKSYYPTLYLVSKKFRSIVDSQDLDKTRSLLDRNQTESCLYLRLRFPCDPNKCWYTLLRKPYQTLTSNRMVEIPFPIIPDTVHQLNSIEVFDPKTQTLGTVTNPGRWIRNGSLLKSLGLEGKYCLFGDDFLVYDPKEGRWNPNRNMGLVVGNSYGFINNVMFKWYDGVFNWFDDKVREWKVLNGVEGLPDFRHRRFCKMVDLGGKMALLWDDHHVNSGGYVETKIWCAEIALQRHDEDDIQGKVEWFDVVLTVNNSCGLWDADAVSAIII